MAVVVVVVPVAADPEVAVVVFEADPEVDAEELRVEAEELALGVETEEPPV